jgi:hypothetical protein
MGPLELAGNCDEGLLHATPQPSHADAWTQTNTKLRRNFRTELYLVSVQCGFCRLVALSMHSGDSGATDSTSRSLSPPTLKT